MLFIHRESFLCGFFLPPSQSQAAYHTQSVCVCVGRWANAKARPCAHCLSAAMLIPLPKTKKSLFPPSHIHTHCPSHIRHSTHTGETYETSRGDMTSQFRHSYNPPALNSLLMHTRTLTRTHRKITLFRREKPYELLIGINYLGRVSYLSVSKQCRYL